MAMEVMLDWRHPQNFTLDMNVKEEEEELADSEYFPEEKEDDEDHGEAESLTVSQFRLRSRPKSLHSPPPVVEVEQREQTLETKQNLFSTCRRPSRPTHITKRKVPGHPQKHGDGGCKRKRTIFDSFKDHEISFVRNQVQDIQANLGADPVFVKSMIRSNVSSCFCLTLPKQFCHLYLPLHDATLTLEVESGEKYRVTFLGERRIVSAGWQKFCTANKLLVGNLLVFRLVKPLKFKVYIMGRHSLAEVDAAFSLLKMKSCATKEVFGKKHLMTPRRDVSQVNIQKKSLKLGTNPELDANQSEDDNEDFTSNLAADITIQGPAADFEDVRIIDNFRILVNGVTIDTQLSAQVRTIYYDLCCSQGSFLHDNILKSIDSKLAAEIITETTNIANAIRACKLPHSRADCVMQEKTLHAFELLGMDVGFLRARLKRCLSVATKYEVAEESKRYLEGEVEQVCMRDKMRDLDSKLSELKETMESFDAKIKALKKNSRKRELIFP
ncbi:B3 domain-containing protein Os01g0234100-like isoform X2 [Pyrus x bretschneideri]|uniref:B3 domain-containing protein Os01g0234100-like isoform X2 n=1 Tax=Pyrus x bretschneideri TaxID=225117 RepID=UPI00202E4BC6|nr:B3 domain-containing protein Os01g0234100-like isoform X2 [Pyrus x bretschneideri]